MLQHHRMGGSLPCGQAQGSWQRRVPPSRMVLHSSSRIEEGLRHVPLLSSTHTVREFGSNSAQERRRDTSAAADSERPRRKP